MKKMILSIIDWLFLRPLAYSWRAVYCVRRFCYQFGFIQSKYFAVPIISVGNISFGGTGKTPFTMWLVDFFEKRQKKTMVLMRGYKGRLEHDHGIIRGDNSVGPNPKDFGDEALLIARRMKTSSVVVGKNRTLNLEHYFPIERPDIVVLDDGHQHLKLKRQLNFVLFDAMMPLKRYDAAPRGYLREGLSSLSSADLAVIGRASIAGPEKVGQLKDFLKKYLRPNIPFALFQYQATGLFNSKFESVHDLCYLQERKVICVSGIASPEAFYSTIEEAGAQIVEKISFPDHHDFTAQEINAILNRAAEAEAVVVTTEKDIVKIRRLIDDERILFIQINLQFIEGEDDVVRLLSNLIEE